MARYLQIRVQRDPAHDPDDEQPPVDQTLTFKLQVPALLDHWLAITPIERAPLTFTYERHERLEVTEVTAMRSRVTEEGCHTKRNMFYTEWGVPDDKSALVSRGQGHCPFCLHCSEEVGSLCVIQAFLDARHLQP
jgi:hypothetical protein